jgi:uncharacterized protein (TIGR03437 family)
VQVTLTVDASGPPKLTVESSAVNFPFAEGASPRTIRRTISNTGGGSLTYRAVAATESGGGWLRIAGETGEATPLSPGSLSISVDPSGLAPGTYTGRVTVSGSGQEARFPVNLSVTAVRQTILLSQTGLAFTAVAGGSAMPPQSFGILNVGQGLMDWNVTASTLAGGDWLSVTPSTGTTDSASFTIPEVNVAVDSSRLAPGEYHGQVRVHASAAVNDPQYVSVLLTVLPPGSDPGPVVRPTGLIFTGRAGGASPGAQTVRVANLTPNAKTFASGTLTIDGANWFTSSPATGNVAPGQPLAIEVSPASTGLAAGIRRGVLTLLFADGAVRNVNLLFVLAAGAGNAARAAEGDCTPTGLLPLITSLGAEFTIPAAWPNAIEARVVDDCGNAVTDGSVVASFSNGDAALPMNSLKDGRWTRTWLAQNTAPQQVTLTVTAETIDRGLRGQAQVSGGLRSSSDPPVLASGGALNGASFAVGAPLSPGSMFSIFGSKLSQGQAGSPRLPLETQLAGALATIGGRQVPLIVATAGQINAIVPYGLTPNTEHQLIVRTGDRYSLPEPIVLAPTQPAIFSKDATGKGQGTIVKATGGLAEPGNAAPVGSVVVVYCTGLGEVDQPVEAGQPAPGSPPAKAIGDVRLRIGEADATVLFAGLVPGFTGLYQVNAIVPENVTPGDAVEVVLFAAGQPSPVVTMAVSR